jgi:hypothetical protein
LNPRNIAIVPYHVTLPQKQCKRNSSKHLKNGTGRHPLPLL